MQAAIEVSLSLAAAAMAHAACQHRVGVAFQSRRLTPCMGRVVACAGMFAVCTAKAGYYM
jgi:hypothetical protein